MFTGRLPLIRLIRDSAIAADDPPWSLVIDPFTGVAVISFDHRFILDRYEIDAAIAALSMHLHAMSLDVQDCVKAGSYGKNHD